VFKTSSLLPEKCVVKFGGNRDREKIGRHEGNTNGYSGKNASERREEKKGNLETSTTVANVHVATMTAIVVFLHLEKSLTVTTEIILNIDEDKTGRQATVIVNSFARFAATVATVAIVAMTAFATIPGQQPGPLDPPYDLVHRLPRRLPGLRIDPRLDVD
jgi:hypothetical protein